MNRNQSKILRDLLEISTSKIDKNIFNGSKILVKGASGHLGTWMVLTLACLLDGHNRFELYCETSRLTFLQKLVKFLNFNCTIHYCDKTITYDVVYDFSLATNHFENDIDFDFITASLHRFRSSLESVKKNGVMITPSSGAVYGNLRFDPISKIESLADQAAGRGTYGELKYFLELLSSQIQDVRVPRLRIFSVFGPLFRDDSNLISNVIFRQSRDQKLIMLDNAGDKKRNFIFVGEIISQIVNLTFNFSVDQTNPLNLGNSEILSIREFSLKVAKISGLELVVGNRTETIDYYIPDTHNLSKRISTISLSHFDDYLNLTSRYYD